MATTPKKRPGRRPKEWSAQHVLFCKRLVANDSQRTAYITAFGAKETDALTDAVASKLARNGKVKQYVQKLINIFAKEAEIEVAELAVLTNYRAKANRAKAIGPDGQPLPVHLWPRELQMCIKGFKFETDKVTEEVIDPETKEKLQKQRLESALKELTMVDQVAATRLLLEVKGAIGQKKEDDSAKATQPLLIGGEAKPQQI